MPVYKDDKRGTWTARFYYTDWTGQRKQKKKRGFKRQIDAKEYEREFLAGLQYDQSKADMQLSTLVSEYIRDAKTRLKLSTIKTKENMINTKILPYLGSIKVSDITPRIVREWQNRLVKSDEEYSQTYLRSIHNQLSAIMNYAVKYYNLPNNPCSIAGSIGKKKAGTMKIWTKEQYEKVIQHVHDPGYFVAFEILYWTGMREGEMLALTPADILPDRKICVNKTFSRMDGDDIFTEPKTEKSERFLEVPKFLYDEIMDYIGRLYGIKDNERIFYFTRSGLSKHLKVAAEKAGVEKIRVHDLRHSHASLLIDMGYSIFAISERLGHEKVSTTMDIYGHLFPNRRTEMIQALDNLRREENEESL